MATKRSGNQHIQVYVRCRPPTMQEKKSGLIKAVEVLPDRKEVVVKDRYGVDRTSHKAFTFDKVFPSDSKQIEVYQAVMGSTISEVMTGYNCTVFAYGQTGTGKTFTMEGERSNANVSWDMDPLAGIIPRTLHQLFENLQSQDLEFTIKVSFLELYNEELFDLLSAHEDTSRLKIYEDSARKGSVIIQGLEEITVHNRHEVFSILEKGAAKRQTAATLLNATSSRSHTVFSVTVHIRETTDDGEEFVKTGKLNLVDLAGSENIGRSGAVDRRAREAGNINQSLLTLGRVITALVDKAPHIPYRESKLTRLLQDSLGGRTKTSIIATISPDMSNLEETLSTLDYANRAKNITNRPEVNQKMTKRALIKEYTEEIERLRRDLVAARDKNGIYVDEENYRTMESMISNQSRVILEREAQIESFHEKIANLEELFSSTSAEVAKKTAALHSTTQQLSLTKNHLEATEKALSKTAIEKNEQQHLVLQHSKTEAALTEKALILVDVAKATTGDVDLLQTKLSRKTTIEEANKRRQSQHMANMEALFGTLCHSTGNRLSTQRQALDALRESFRSLEHQVRELQETNAALASKLKEADHRAAKVEKDVLASILTSLTETLAQQGTTAKCHLAENNSFLKDLCETGVSPLICNAQQNLQAMTGNSAALRDQVASLFQEVSRRFTQQEALVGGFCKQAASLQLELQRKNKEIEQLKDSLQNRTISEDEHLEAYMAAVSTLQQRQQSALEAYLGARQSWRKDNDMEFAKMANHSSELSGIASSIVPLVTRVSDAVTSTAKTVLSDLACIQEASAKHTETVVSNVAATHTILSSVNDNLLSRTSTLLEALSEQGATQGALGRKLSERVAEAVSEGTIAVESHSQEIGCILNQLEDKTTSGCTRQRIICHDGMAKVDSAEGITTSLNLETEETIAECRGTMGRFFEQELEEYIPTGCTPQRKEYPFPTTLPCTSPHDTILRRLRATLNVNEAAALPFSNLEVSEAINLELPDSDGTVSKASSMESVCSNSDKENSTRHAPKAKTIPKGRKKLLKAAND